MIAEETQAAIDRLYHEFHDLLFNNEVNQIIKSWQSTLFLASWERTKGSDKFLTLNRLIGKVHMAGGWLILNGSDHEEIVFDEGKLLKDFVNVIKDKKHFTFRDIENYSNIPYSSLRNSNNVWARRSLRWAIAVLHVLDWNLAIRRQPIDK